MPWLPKNPDLKNDPTYLEPRISDAESQLADNAKETKKHFLKPFFVEYFASFNNYGRGTPSGIANYTGGKYVLGITGNAGESFVTVTSGNIADAGATTKWACVIQNDDGIFDTNKVLGSDGINKLTLLSPLKRNITNGKIGNLHDADLGQHYTELGYYAFAQHLYYSTPRYTERNNVIAQFLEDDTDGKWTINGVRTYNSALSMNTPDNSYRVIGGKALVVYMVDGTKYLEWQENLNGYKGYVEAFVGCDTGSYKVDFYQDDVLVDSKTYSREVRRIIFPFEYAKTGKIKISALGAYPQNIYVGRVTWFVNEKYSKSKLIEPNMKIVYIGDSWGEFHNKATTRELTRLMTADGGVPTVLDFSKGGHTSTYARAWFDEYIIKNKPDVVIIEYFTNDFNSIGGVNVGTFLAPDGTQQDMNITSLTQYLSNMQYMIDKAIENGIQPIVIMPASTNSESQVLSFANKGNDVWNGTKITNDKPYFQEATLGKTVTNSIEANGEMDLIIKGKAINSSARRGIVTDSDRNLTGGYIHKFANNGVDKAGVKYDGSMEQTAAKLLPQSSTFGNNINTRGSVYLLNSAGTNNIDELRTIIQLADGTYAQRHLSLEERAPAVPTAGTYRVGDRIINTTPVAGGYLGWVCVTTGTANNTAWVASTAYSVGNRINANNSVYECTVAGTSGTTAPSHTSGEATDGTVTWKYIGALAVFKGFGAIQA